MHSNKEDLAKGLVSSDLQTWVNVQEKSKVGHFGICLPFIDQINLLLVKG